jgi:hypothetical protein
LPIFLLIRERPLVIFPFAFQILVVSGTTCIRKGLSVNRIIKISIFCLALSGLCFSASARADALYTFDSGVSSGTSTPFNLTDNGVTATFSSPGQFEVEPNFGFAPPFSGNVLADDLSGAPLFISFSTEVTSISLDFATDDVEVPSTLELVAIDGSTPVGFTGAQGTFINEFPQGILTFSGSTFDGVELFDDQAPAFAIDNVDVSFSSAGAAGVPEINTSGLGAMVLLLLGALALLEARRSRVR